MLKDISLKMKQWVAEKKYSEVLELYKTEVNNRFSIDEIVQQTWAAAYVMLCLRKTAKHLQALKFAENTLKLTMGTMPLQVWREYVWAVYGLLRSENAERAKYAEIACLLLDAPQMKTEKLAEAKLVLATAEFWSKQPNANYARVAQLLAAYSADMFDDKPFAVSIEKNGKPKETELASDREKWYMMFIAALYKWGSFEACIGVCNNALKLPKLHYSNHVWFTRRKALALAEIGETTEAKTLMLAILKQKTDWFLLLETAKMCFTLKQTEQATQLLAQAALVGGDIEKRTAVYKLWAEILENTNPEKARQHRLLAAQCRVAMGGKADEKTIAEFGAQTVGTHPRTLYKQLCSFWQQLAQTGLQKGVILKILHAGNKGDGFVKNQQGQTFYFRTADIQNFGAKYAEGAAVRFDTQIVEHKGKETPNAVKILLI